MREVIGRVWERQFSITAERVLTGGGEDDIPFTPAHPSPRPTQLLAIS